MPAGAIGAGNIAGGTEERAKNGEAKPETRAETTGARTRAVKCIELRERNLCLDSFTFTISDITPASLFKP